MNLGSYAPYYAHGPAGYQELSDRFSMGYQRMGQTITLTSHKSVCFWSIWSAEFMHFVMLMSVTGYNLDAKDTHIMHSPVLDATVVL